MYLHFCNSEIIGQFWRKNLKSVICPPIPTITHLDKGAVISDFPLVIAFSRGSNIYRPLLEKSTFIPFKLH